MSLRRQLLAAGLAGVLVACGGGTDTAGTQEVVHDERGFVITAPADWIVEKDAFGVALSLRPPREQARLTHITVAVDDNRPLYLPGQGGAVPPDLERYATLKLERTGYLTAPAQVHARDAGELNGTPVVRATRSYRSGPVEYTARHYFLLGAEGNGYTLTATAPREDFDTLAPRFDAILESFVLLGDEG